MVNRKKKIEFNIIELRRRKLASLEEYVYHRGSLQ